MAFVETNRPELPKGWQFRRLLEIADVVDSLHQTPKYVETGLPMVRVTDIKPGFLRLENTLRVPEAVFADFTRNARPQRPSNNPPHRESISANPVASPVDSFDCKA